MTKVLLSVHVIAAILVVGPIAVAASLFPRYARDSAPVAAVLNRICRGYTVVGLSVPVFGVATGAALGVLTDPWLVVSVVLTAVAAGILALGILPEQRRMLAAAPSTAAPDPAPATRAGRDATAARVTALTGVFNLTWAVVVVLMIVRPGSTTGT